MCPSNITFLHLGQFSTSMILGERVLMAKKTLRGNTAAAVKLGCFQILKWSSLHISIQEVAMKATDQISAPLSILPFSLHLL